MPLPEVPPGGGPLNAASSSERPALPLTGATMRAAASWFLAQETLPRHQTVKLFGEDFSAYLKQLIPQVEQLAGARAEGDAQAMVALAGTGEARRRLGIAQCPGLNGEVERVKRLARSVVALRDHYDALTGVRMCVACDQVIEDGDEALPYDQISPTGRTGSCGRIHRRCLNVLRNSCL